MPDHAAVDLSVRLAQADRRAARYAGLVNAVLRRVAQNRARALADEAARDTPDWLLKRWSKHYGADTARAIAQANGQEPALDLTVKQDAASWAEHLRGRVLPTGSVRTLAQGPITLLPGFNEGAWWVQDAAASLPARLFGDVRDRAVADLCAAPGGKTAQLAFAGARVTAVDRSPRGLRASPRILRGFRFKPRPSPPTCWNGKLSRSMPCCSMRPAPRPVPSGGIPMCPGSRAKPTSPPSPRCSRSCSTARSNCSRPAAFWSIASARWNRKRPNGRSPRCWRATRALPASRWRRRKSADHAEFLTADGDLRTLPLHLSDPDPRWGGLDGFYAARLARNAP